LPRDALRAFEDMLSFARQASSIAAPIRREDLETRPEFRYALERLVELTGEAAKRVPPKEREFHPQIPWRNIVGMRDKLAHDYEFVSLNRVWETVSSNLPELISQLEAILAKRHRR
jgi:uncharacterized protein with HEPN domain